MLETKVYALLQCKLCLNVQYCAWAYKRDTPAYVSVYKLAER